MAKIKGNEIIEDNHLDNAVKSVKELTKGYELLSKEIKETAKLAKTGLGKANTNTAKGIREVNAEVKKSTTLRKTSLKIDKEKIKLSNQLKQATDEQVKGKLRLREVTRKQTEALKTSIQLEKAEAGSLNKLSLTVKKYELELRKLNLTTVAGRKRQQELITKINQSNAVFKKNSSALSAQRINVGNYGSALTNVKGALTSMINPATLALGAVFALGSAVKDAIELFSKFEQANANLASILGDSKEGIKALTEDAKRLGSVSAFTASQIVGLQTELAKLGFNRQEILDSTEAIQRLAQATGTELAQSAVQVGATIRAFNLDASEAGRVVDVLASSTSKSALDMTKLATALPIVSSTAKVAGVSLERTTALLGTLSDRGLDASTSGTALRNIFLDLSKHGLTWEEAMFKINNATDKNATAMNLFGKRGATSAIILAENADASDRLTRSLLLSGGTAEQMADTQLDTLTGSVTLMKSAYEGFILGLEDGNGTIAETIRNLVDATTAFLQLISGIEQTDEALRSLPLGETIVMIKNFGDTWGVAFESLDNFQEALASTLDILIAIATFGLIENYSHSVLGLGKALDDTTKAQRENSRIIRIASKNINRLEKDTGALVVAENKRIQSLVDGNLSQEERNALISDLTDKYPELIKNYDLENLTQEQAIELQKQLRIEIAETVILKEKAQALDLVRIRFEAEELKVAKIKNKVAREQREKEIEFEKNRQLQRIDNIEQEVRNQLGLNEKIEDLNDSATDNAIDNDGKRVSSFKNSSKEIIDHAEIEEQRLADLRSQRQKDIDDNNKENDKARDKRDREERERIAKNNKIQEDADKARLDKEKELAAERLKRQKDNFQALTDLLNSVLQIQQDKLDSQIENSKNNIKESQGEIDVLQQQAILGNADAEASIKAEKQKIANEKENIDALEKKKRDLQILVTGLAFANQKIQNGDGNALANAGSEMSNFISNLKGFYNGTETTLGADLGNAYAITGDRDTHIIKAHKDEHIIGVENSRKLGNMSQDDIVKGAMMLKNGEFVGRRAIGVVNSRAEFNDLRMVKALDNNTKTIEQAIKNIPEYKFNYDSVNKMAIDSIKIGNKTTNNHKKIGGMFS